MRSREQGFTLIELLIVVAIIGIIAAIAIPNLMTAIQRGKQKRAMGEVRAIATAAQSYATDLNIYPIQDTFGSLRGSQADSDMVPEYVKKIPDGDPWNFSYMYLGTSTSFGVESYGLDNASQATPDLSLGSSVTRTNCFECDIIWVDSGFQIFPEAKQVRCR